jgi:hypothetical protein
LEFKIEAEGLLIVGTGIAPVLRPDIPSQPGAGGQRDFRVPEHLAGVCERLLPPSVVRVRGEQLAPDFQGLQETTFVGRLAQHDLEETHFCVSISQNNLCSDVATAILDAVNKKK